jgi:hypothetical protein
MGPGEPQPSNWVEPDCLATWAARPFSLKELG